MNNNKFKGFLFEEPLPVKADSEGDFYFPTCEKIKNIIKSGKPIDIYPYDSVLLVRLMFDDRFYDFIAHYEDDEVYFREFMSNVHKAGIKAVVPISYAIDLFEFSHLK